MRSPSLATSPLHSRKIDKSRIKKKSTCGKSTVKVALHAKTELETRKMPATLITRVERAAERGTMLHLHRIGTTNRKDFAKKSVSVLFSCFSALNSLRSLAFQSFAFFSPLKFKLSKSFG